MASNESIYYPFPKAYKVKDHSGNATMVFHYLLESSDKNGSFTVSKRQIAEFLKIDKTTVDRVFSQLVKENHIRITSSSVGRTGSTKGEIVFRADFKPSYKSKAKSEETKVHLTV